MQYLISEVEVYARTATLRGRFITNIALRQEFYSLIKK